MRIEYVGPWPESDMHLARLVGEIVKLPVGLGRTLHRCAAASISETQLATLILVNEPVLIDDLQDGDEVQELAQCRWVLRHHP